MWKQIVGLFQRMDQPINPRWEFWGPAAAVLIGGLMTLPQVAAGPEEFEGLWFPMGWLVLGLPSVLFHRTFGSMVATIQKSLPWYRNIPTRDFQLFVLAFGVACVLNALVFWIRGLG